MEEKDVFKSYNFCDGGYFVIPTGRGYFQLFNEFGEPVSLELNLKIENPAEGFSSFEFTGICNCVENKFEMFRVIDEKTGERIKRIERNKKAKWWQIWK